MNETEESLARTIAFRIALAIIQGEENPRNEMLKRYGEFGFELTEAYILEQFKTPKLYVS